MTTATIMAAAGPRRLPATPKAPHATVPGYTADTGETTAPAAFEMLVLALTAAGASGFLWALFVCAV